MIDPAPARYATKPHGRRRHRLDAVRSAANRLGLPLMPWQAQVARVATEHRADGRPYYETVICTVPRQSGKSVLALALMIEVAERVPDAQIAYTAQARQDAARRVIDASRVLRRSGLDMSATRGIGNELIRFPNGSEIFVISPNATGAHGASLDLAVLDEAWAVDPIVMGGIVPAMAARPNSQLIVISTAGTLESELLNGMIAQGRQAVEEGRRDTFAYFEWSMADDADPYSPDTWHSYHPALGFTVDEARIQAALDTPGLSPSEFIRAYCNVMVTSVHVEIPSEWWEVTARPYAERPEHGITLAVDIGMGPDSGSVAAAFPTENGRHVELLDYRAGDLGWITSRVFELVDNYGVEVVVMDAIGPAALIVTELRSGLESRRVELRIPKSGEVATAAANFYEGLRTGDVTHGTYDALERAVAGAVRKRHGDQWSWSRRNSKADVSPLIACSLAVWSVREQELVPRPKMAIW